MFGSKKIGGVAQTDWDRLKSRIALIREAYANLKYDADRLAYFAAFRLEEFAQGKDLPDDLLEFPIELNEQYVEDFRKGVYHIVQTQFFDCDYVPEPTKNGFYAALDWCAKKEADIEIDNRIFEVTQKLALLFLNFHQGLPKTTEQKGQPRLFVTVEDDYLGDKLDTIIETHVVLDQINETTRSIFFPNNDQGFLEKENLGQLPLKFALTKYTGLPEVMFSFLDHQGSFEIPEKARFEHMHVLARSGHGKTQLLENFIFNDILRAHDQTIGLAVIDGQADLINDIKHLKALAPIQDRVILLNPSDIDHPFCLNPFDIANTLKGDLSPAQKQEVYTNAVYLLEYVFSSLGANLTSKQKVLFGNVVELLVTIEGATLMDMKNLLEDSAPYRPYYEQLDPLTKDFFTNQFESATFADTKYQVLTRLYAILKTPALARMFTAKTNQLDVFEEMNRGAIILIDTDKSLLKDAGHSLLGRYFLALIVQSAFKRKFTPESERTPFYVYVDECHDYMDENIATMLEQARKYKVGMVLSHQLYDQLDTRLKATIKTNTSIKIHGALSAKDRTASAKEMDVKEDQLSGLKSIDRKGAEYLLKVGNQKPVKVFAPFGVMQSAGVIDSDVLEHIVRKNRERYCAQAATENIGQPTPQNSSEFTTEGKKHELNNEKPAPKGQTGFSIEDVEDL